MGGPRALGLAPCAFVQWKNSSLLCLVEDGDLCLKEGVDL